MSKHSAWNELRTKNEKEGSTHGRSNSVANRPASQRSRPIATHSSKIWNQNKITVENFVLNDGFNYMMSPAARHANIDGSLELLHNHTFNKTYNRKLKMRDTFTKIFPSYNHSEPTVFKANRPWTETTHFYPAMNDSGRKTHVINREYTHKVDEIKFYSETMYKMEDFMKGAKPAGKN